jgi:hypothetical protein
MPIIAKTGGKSKQSFPAAEDEKKRSSVRMTANVSRF